MEQMEVRNVLVTGGLGFVGSHIVRHIRNKYPQCLVTILDTRIPESTIEDVLVKHVQADITCVSSVREALLAIRPQAVIHSAAIVPELAQRYRRTLEKIVTNVNVAGTRNVLEASKEAGVEAFVYTSSCTAVTDDFSQSYANIDERWPLVEVGKASIYGESKAQAELLVRAANGTLHKSCKTSLKTCALRLAIVCGEGDEAFLPSIISLIRDKTESPFRIGNGANLWDLLYVGNAADAHVLALENLLSTKPTAAGEAFFIQNNEPASARDLMLFIWNTWNGHIPPFEVEIPTRLAWTLGLIAECYTWITGKPTTLSRGSVQDATTMRYASGLKAKQILGYDSKVPLEEALKLSIKDYAARLHDKAATKS